MKKSKEIGYGVNSVAFRELDGYPKLWNIADFETKERIIKMSGEIAINLTINKLKKKLTKKAIRKQAVAWKNAKDIKGNNLFNPSSRDIAQDSFIEGANWILNKLKIK